MLQLAPKSASFRPEAGIQAQGREAIADGILRA